MKLIYYVPGTILILTAIVILFFPEIIIALVAAVLLAAGIMALYIGNTVRRSEHNAAGFETFFGDDGCSGWRFAKSPFFRKWDRRQ